MIREDVQSSMICTLGYEPETSTLEIEFNSGAVWQYYDIPEYVFYEMKDSGSVGKFFNANIRGQYPESQVG